MKCEIRWIKDGKATPDSHDAIGLCGVMQPECTLDHIDGCKMYQETFRMGGGARCYHPMVDGKEPQAFAIC